MSIEKIYNEFEAISQTEAIALGGSRAFGTNDEKSDYDLYVYVSNPIPEATRKDILSKYCKAVEIGNHFWEYEDNCRLNNDIDLDIIYRNIEDFDKSLYSTVIEHTPSNGYTTCMWHNLLNSSIIFDRNGKLKALKEKYEIPYPEKLKENIIKRNTALLSGFLPSYDKQIKKALSRRDIAAVNNRVNAFLESYFDIIFALNKITHPGEKRLIQLCIQKCNLLPGNFKENLEKLFSELYTTDNTMSNIEAIITELQKIL